MTSQYSVTHAALFPFIKEKGITVSIPPCLEVLGLRNYSILGKLVQLAF